MASNTRKKASAVNRDVEFSMRGPLAATWGSSEDHRNRTGACVLDLLFASPTQVGELVFRNYYTARVSVLARLATSAPALTRGGAPTSSNTITRQQGDEAQGAWQLAVARRILMPFPHHETGSHDLVSIPATESVMDLSNVLALRLVLEQPSPVWRTFHVEEISVSRHVPRRASRTLSLSVPSWNELRQQTEVALRKNNVPDREGPPPKDFVGLVGYEVQGLAVL